MWRATVGVARVCPARAAGSAAGAAARCSGPLVAKNDHWEEDHETTDRQLDGSSSVAGVGGGDPSPGSTGAGRNATTVHPERAEFFVGYGSNRGSGVVPFADNTGVRQAIVPEGEHAWRASRGG